MLGRTPPKPAMPLSDTDVQVAWLVHQRDQARLLIDDMLRAHASRPGSVSLPDALLDLRNVLDSPRGDAR